MAFAIMRCKKLNGMGSVAAALKHCFRERETFNADPERTPTNDHVFSSSTDEAMGQLREKLPEKRRKDAVLCVEYLFTASPEWWKQASSEQQEDFFNKSLQWLHFKYGEKNVLVASIHRDETSPHMSAFVVPITADGRLSAKEFIGDRKRMSQDQTTFAHGVRHLGLERGIEGSKAHHTTIAAYYAKAAMPAPKEPAIVVPEPSMVDRFNPKKYGERVAETVMEQVRPVLSVLASKATEAHMAKEDKVLYQRVAKRKEQQLAEAQKEAQLEANARVSRREQELELTKVQVLSQVEQEWQRTKEAEQRNAELAAQLERSKEEARRADLAQRQYVANLLNASEEQVLNHLRDMKERISLKERQQDRDNDLEM